MKKKLKLHLTTIAHLTAPDLSRAIGGVSGNEGAGIQSVKIDTRVEPCQTADPELVVPPVRR
jgi:hypothetical protein